ncbi:MAG: serine hydrolase domain-containing protein [Micropepsaceae bacterium]
MSQIGGNIVAAVFDPDGKIVDLVDRSGMGHVETIEVFAKKTGAYAVQTAIFEWNTPAAEYAIVLVRQERAGASPEAIADQLISSWYDPAHPGAAVAVVKGGRIVFQRTTGLANVEDGIPITPNTRFDLASVSKQFTAYAVAMLVERGTIGLEDDVRRYLPEIPQFDRPIKIRHLLDHTSGLRDWDAAFGLMGLSIENGVTKDKIVDMVARQKELNFAPGTAQQYSNTGYNLLAEAVSRATGVPFETWVRRNIFEPAGMTAIVNTYPQGVVRTKANSYSQQVPSPQLASGNSTSAAGSSSMNASINDLAAWVRNSESGKVGSPSVLAMIKEPGHLDDGSKLEYGFGRWFGERNGVRFVGHLGLAVGYRISFRRFPERDLAFIFMTNDGNDASYARAKTIENLFLGLTEGPVQVPEDEFTSPEAAPKLTHDVRDYGGIYYSDELRTSYEIRGADGGLTAFHAINGAIPLVVAGGDNFRSDRWFLPSIAFVRDGRNGISGFRVSTEGARNMLFRRIESD